MLYKSQPDEIESYLSDASNMRGGRAERVVFPADAAEVAQILAEATRAATPVTVSGAGTGTVGGRVPCGGIVLATDKLNRIKAVEKTFGVAEAGVVLADFQRAARSQGLFYPPDPTERSAFLGGTVATNASGARTFKYGPTRRYVERLQLVLATGDLLELRRGAVRADAQGVVRLPLANGRTLAARVPAYAMPRTRKHVAGYFAAPEMDALDLFIGSEGTLGVVTEIEARLLPLPAGALAGVVFFTGENGLLAFVDEARKTLSARALEYFDGEALNFLRPHFPEIPEPAAGAVFFEQETTPDTEDQLFSAWAALMEKHGAAVDDSWFATSERDRERLQAFRHRLPVLVNEFVARHGQRKLGTDLAVPDAAFPEMLRFYQDTLRAAGLGYVIFGHVGDNHVHVNLLPRDDAEAQRGREIYAAFVRRAVALGGTVSAEHGIGKLKRDYLRELYDERALAEMAALKRALDPAGILGRGNIFPYEKFTTEQLSTPRLP
jgi:D-lactate dehydrogenase (cytochrome)